MWICFDKNSWRGPNDDGAFLVLSRTFVIEEYNVMSHRSDTPRLVLLTIYRVQYTYLVLEVSA